MGKLSKEEATEYQRLLRAAQPDKYRTTAKRRQQLPENRDIMRDYAQLKNLAFPELAQESSHRRVHANFRLCTTLDTGNYLVQTGGQP